MRSWLHVLLAGGRSVRLPPVAAFADQARRGGGASRTGFSPALGSAFSLIELLVVIGLIGALCLPFVGVVGGGEKSTALRSAQAMLANFIITARVKALASGASTRVLLQVDANHPSQPPRFLHSLALQLQTAGGWQTVAELSLPDGVYVVPGNFTRLPAGLFADAAASAWTKAAGSALRSTALRDNQLTTEAINAGGAEQWVGIVMAPNGHTAQSGDIVLTVGRVRSPAPSPGGESPVELYNSALVCGLTLSAYGVPALINDRTGF